jgi:DnaJ-class molecular chaperone
MDHSTARGILGVSAEASIEETRSRFRALAKLHHPDLNPGKDGTNFVLVSDAYLVLQGKEVGLSKNKDAEIYTFHMTLLKQCMDGYFNDMTSNFIQSIGAIERGFLDFLAVRR